MATRKTVAPTSGIEATSWNASFEDVGGANPDVGNLDPNEIGIDNPPDHVLAQFNVLAAAARSIIGSKVLGMDTTFDIELSGTASSGHQEGDEVSIVITKNMNALSVDTVPNTAEPVIYEQSGPTPDGYVQPQQLEGVQP